MTTSLQEKGELLTVSNVKLSCAIELLDGESIILNKEVNKKCYSNFTVVRKKYVYIIFKRRNKANVFHVNITKVPSIEQVKTSIEELNSIITNNFIVRSHKIENLTCSYDAGFNIPLIDAFDQIKQKSYVKKVRFNPERFPGMFVSFDSITLILFSSGKMVIIGAKNTENTLHCLKLIMTFLNQYKIWKPQI